MDVMECSWRLTGNSVNCPQILISAKLVDSATQTQVISDLRESQGKQVLFPNVVQNLTADEKQELMEQIVQTLIRIYMRRVGG